LRVLPDPQEFDSKGGEIEMKKNLKILAAIDGSDQAMNAVRYISAVFPPERTEVVLFHVHSKVPESFTDLERGDLGKDAMLHSCMEETSAWSAQVKKDIDQFMERAQTALVEANFSPGKIKIKVQPKKVGIARDILEESGRDRDRKIYLAQSRYPQDDTLKVSQERYDALVVGRTGVSKVHLVHMGSIANKLVAKTPHIPIAVVGGHPETEKVIIGFDGSKDAMRAVNCVGELMGAPQREVMLCHVIRPLNIHLGIKKIFHPDEEIKWVECKAREIEPLIDEAAKRLVAAGFSPDHVHKQIQTGKKSRAKAIVTRAAADCYGTIAVGRHGLTEVEEFFIGRVSTKVLHMAEEMAVWIV
jgi:nucleotide-binding universal stress UspA family protein